MPIETQSAAPPARSSWYHHWKDIATMTSGILPHEPRLKTVLAMVDRCTEAYNKDDEAAFLRLKQQLANLIQASTPRVKATVGTSVPTSKSA